MARLAMISTAVDWELLEALNPARPAPPKEVREPSALDVAGNPWLQRLRSQLFVAKRRMERADLKKQIGNQVGELREAFKAQRKAFSKYRADLEAWCHSEVLRSAGRKLSAGAVDLERRGLLQWDRRRGQFDLHPVVRGYAVQLLDPGARAETGQRIADYFSSRASTPYEDASSRSGLQNGVQVVQALNLGGKTQKAWDVLSRGLDQNLYRLELYYDSLALLRSYFPQGWLAPPSGVDDVRDVAHRAGLALTAVGQRKEATFQDTVCTQESAREGLGAHLASDLLNLSYDFHQENCWAHAERLLYLAREIAEAVEDKAEVAWCDVLDVLQRTSRGRLTEALSYWNAIQPHLCKTASYDGWLEADAIWTQILMLFRVDILTSGTVTSAIGRVHSLGARKYERRLRSLQGQWLQSNGDDAAAAESFAHAIEMAHAVGLHDTEAEARRGLSLARLGRRSEAEAAAVSAERDPPHDVLAELYWELGERDKARHHAIEGYKFYWGDGPPYASHWELEACRAVLEKLGEAPPPMKPFDPASIEPFPFEADIRSLLAEHAAKKGKA